VLVLDDYHFIQSSQIHDQVTFLVDHLPATMNVVILAGEPPPALARLRAQGELLELQSTDLQFTPEKHVSSCKTSTLLTSTRDDRLPA
jgi:LuxR family maltose regulon positive regulatory protein